MCPTGADASTMAICIFQQVQIPCSFLPSFLGWAGGQDESQASSESGGWGGPGGYWGITVWLGRQVTDTWLSMETPQAIYPDMELKVSITY